MKKILNGFLQKLTFERQLDVMVTLGILFLALFSSVVGSWQSNERVRANLIEQGQRITENLAHQSALALIYASADNAAEAVNATMAFPGVVSVEIRDVSQHTLLTRGNADPAKFPTRVERADWVQGAAILDAESRNAWRFAAPVYTQSSAESPFNVQTAAPELLGHVSVVMSKAALSQTTTDIFVVNLATSFSFALLFLFLIRFLTNRMTRPLNQLSASMGRAKAGESKVRAVLTGQKDIADMAHAFNSMMKVLEERETALSVAAIAFEIEEGMIVTDRDEVIIRVNRVFTKLTGYSAEESIGKTLSLLKFDRQDTEFYSRMRESLHRDNYWQGEIWNRRKNGEIYPEWLTITAVVGTDGEITNYVCAFSDITERKEAEEKICALAFYDTLTQLPNRRFLLDRLQQALALSVRTGRQGALLFIDLDNFKSINDTQGHAVGDLLLVEVANRLQGCIREGDTTARLGGDEFVVLLEDLDTNEQIAATQAETVGEKICETIGHPYLINGHEHHSTASIGITLFRGPVKTMEEMLKRADVALYQAKADGRDTVRFFDPAMQTAVSARVALESDLRRAVSEQEQFLLYYQGQVDSSGRMTGAEALVRWRHPERGMVSPADFIPLAEESGLILPLGHWVMTTACQQLAAWATQPEMAHLTVAVNVSAKQFHLPTFVEEVLALIDYFGVDTAKLKLEITESLLLDNVDDIITKMTALKARGISFSMDDFGTGYSSLSYLKRLPLYQLKIDQSFVRDVLTDPNDAAIAKIIISLAKSMNLAVIAEGVETEAQRKFLELNGCHAFQGYLFSKPVPVKEFEQLVERYAQQPPWKRGVDTGAGI
ncbi:MAG: EAL domain-containing protein [Gallionella sp.]|nr:EAL domain-containing protein [Gallionella sp.]